ncbi:MAG: heme-binding protein [Bacteroidetes bacterium]|nr:heme-binding protein [Bacteroidota bacterium]MDA0828648.1 heme-binding protein [Bacteroidota bacterium]MDA1199659.1 heme-binding protein [Bacteroidota bacterium]
MRLTRMQWILISGAAIIAAYTGFAYTQSKKLDRPSYEVVKRDGSFEIRDYGARLWAEVSVSQAEYGAMSREGFRPLARYIFGGNESQTSMAMTAPVSLIMEETDPRMRFFMSDKGRAADLPKPLQEGIRFIEEPAQRYAVLSYGGLLSQERNMEFGQKLKAWCDAEGLVIEGPLEVYGYNAPYEVIRHNEVAFPIGRR